MNDTDGGDVDTEAVENTLRVLASQRRLHVLLVLSEIEAPALVDVVARRVAARESGNDPASVGDDRIERVRQSLHHVHLPKLRHADLVEHDEANETLQLKPNAIDVERIIDAVFG